VIGIIQEEGCNDIYPNLFVIQQSHCRPPIPAQGQTRVTDSVSIASAYRVAIGNRKAQQKYIIKIQILSIVFDYIA
jgi:hypothetical protein